MGLMLYFEQMRPLLTSLKTTNHEGQTGIQVFTVGKPNLEKSFIYLSLEAKLV
jgi:hypothetical protein